MLLLSSVRMGINLGLIDDLSISTVNELFIQTQPAFLQKLRRVGAGSRGAELSPEPPTYAVGWRMDGKRRGTEWFDRGRQGTAFRDPFQL